jgi:tetratricopeptide (TPR) repeat protein
MPQPDAFQNTLKELMGRFDRYPAALAKLSRDVPQRTIENWAGGKSRPTRPGGLLNLLKIAAVFPLDEQQVDDLLATIPHPPVHELRQRARRSGDAILLSALEPWASASGRALDPLHQLRAPVTDYVGREREIVELTSVLTSGGGATISGVAGMGGIGKTELALVVANALTERYPDAQIVLNLQGSREPALSVAQAFQQILRTFQPDAHLPDDEPSLVAAYRSVLSGKHVLILADDAKDAAQVKPLLPPPGSALLITSRQRFTLPGMRRFDLERLDVREAVALLRDICRRLSDDEAGQIAAASGRLPLALRIAGGLLANDETLGVDRYLGRVADERRKLEAFRDPDDADLDVEASIALSYDLLGQQAQAALRCLGVFAASFDLEAASAVLAHESQDELESKLGLLYRRSLVEFVPDQRRYDLHELVRVFALARLHEVSPDEERGARLRHARHYIGQANSMNERYQQGGEESQQSLLLFDQERPNLNAARRWLQGQAGNAEVDQLLVTEARATNYIGEVRFQRRSEQLPQLEAALAAAQRLGDIDAQCRFLGNLGNVYFDLQDLAKAREFYDANVAVAEQHGQQSSLVSALYNRGLLLIHAHAEEEHILSDLTRAEELARESGMTEHEARMAELHGQRLFAAKRFGEALPLLEHAVALNRQAQGSAIALSSSLYLLADLTRSLGSPEQALEYAEEARTLAEQADDRPYLSCALRVIGDIHLARSELAQAKQALSSAREVMSESEPDPYDELFLLVAEGELAIQLGQLSDGLAKLNQAEPGVREYGVAYLLDRIAALRV